MPSTYTSSSECQTLYRSNTIEIVSERSHAAENDYKKIKKEFSDLKKTRATSTEMKDKKLELKEARLERNVRRKMYQTIVEKGDRLTPFFHFYKKHPECDHRKESTINHPELLECVTRHAPNAAFEMYHNELNQTKLRDTGLVKAYKPSLIDKISSILIND